MAKILSLSRIYRAQKNYRHFLRLGECCKKAHFERMVDCASREWKIQGVSLLETDEEVEDAEWAPIAKIREAHCEQQVSGKVK